MDRRFGTRSVKSLQRADSFVTAVKELTKYELDLVALQEATWDITGTKEHRNIYLYMEGAVKLIN